jgi:RNA polymerase sigma-70 factor (ECF subfamily)
MSSGAGTITAPDALRHRDGELLRRVRARDTSALAELYDAHAGYAMAVALRIVRNRSEAEEVVQDVFWHLWKSQLAYDPSRGRFTTWLFAVVRNRAIDPGLQ